MLRFDGFIFTLLNLVVLYVAMRHFLIGPIQNVLAARKEMIDKQFAAAQSKEDEAMQLKQRYDGLLENAKEESKQIVEESRTRAGKEYEERVQKAERQANRIGKSKTGCRKRARAGDGSHAKTDCRCRHGCGW